MMVCVEGCCAIIRLDAEEWESHLSGLGGVFKDGFLGLPRDRGCLVSNVLGDRNQEPREEETHVE